MAASTTYKELELRVKKLETGYARFQVIAEDAEIRQKMLNSVTELILWVDKEMKILWSNQPAADLIDKTVEELVGQTCFNAFTNSTEICQGCMCQTAFSTGRPEQGIIQIPHGNEEGTFWFHLGIPHKDENDLVSRVACITNNVTEKITFEKELQENESWFRKLFESAPLGYQSLDEHGNFIGVNQAWLDTFGYSQEEV
ncbi:MAG: PAS domain-containing protein, partial [Bacteroidetes bacterium]|nr:PAS domain-containing protein [Bacteroidota bacterium]